MIAPLLSADLDPGMKTVLRRAIMEKHGLSERTIRRYLQHYREQGFSGLVTSVRSDKGTTSMDPRVLQTAIELKQELPSRSVRRILVILEGEGRIKPGEVAQSTLTRLLRENGYGSNYRKEIVCEPTAARRFQRKGRNVLWQADIKYMSFIPGKNGKMKQTYLLSIIDDSTRMVVHAELYDNQKLPILEDAFRKALLAYGKPDAILVDNGKIFVSKWFQLACARLGVEHIRCRPYNAKGKGKEEKWNQFVDEFLEELSLEPVETLPELNRKFRVWMVEGYIHKPHEGIKNMTPAYAWRSDPRKVSFVTPEQCYQLFLWEVSRKVNKIGSLSFYGNQYDAGTDLIGKKVDVRYDPFDLSVLEIWNQGRFIKKVVPLIIGEHLAKEMISTPPEKVATHSRLLAVYEQRNKLRDQKQNDAISFRSLKEGK